MKLNPLRQPDHTMHPGRRTFCRLAGAALVLGPHVLSAQADLAAQGTSRPNVAAIDYDRILAAANLALQHPPTPLTSLPAPPAPATPHDFFSIAEPDGEEISSAHRDALLQLALDVPALAAAATIVRPADAPLAERYTTHARKHLDAWFVTPATRMSPAFPFAQYLLPAKTGNQGGNPEGLMDATGLAEIAVAIPFLQLDADALDAIKQWFAQLLEWLTTSRLAALTRDSKNRYGSVWLLQTVACARLLHNEAVLADCRHRFKSITIRAEIEASGLFPHELTTTVPLRNSLLNLDLLAGACQLLTTRFENVWEHELQDGPGMRAAIARFYPYIKDRAIWPYKADLTNFQDLPGRRAALLFGARAYSRPEYATVWKSLAPDPKVSAILRSMPIHQPLLWVTQPKP